MKVKAKVSGRTQVFEVDLPGHYEVCSRCRGTGTHVNPSVDGNGIDPQEFHDDPEFAENYFGGLYDVECYECRGKRVVPVVDVDRLTPKMRKRYEQYQYEEQSVQAEAASERFMESGWNRWD